MKERSLKRRVKWIRDITEIIIDNYSHINFIKQFYSNLDSSEKRRQLDLEGNLDTKGIKVFSYLHSAELPQKKRSSQLPKIEIIGSLISI